MSLIIYQFDSTDEYPLLDNGTNARGRVRFQTERDGRGTYLCVTYNRVASDGDRVKITLLLPPRSIAGQPDRIAIEARCNTSGCSLFLDAGDSLGWGFTYHFPPLESGDWQTVNTPAQSPSEHWGHRAEQPPTPLSLPLRFCRFGITVCPGAQPVRLSLRSLSIEGEAHFVPTGFVGQETP